MKKFAPIFVASFFLSLHTGAVLYVNSSLLAQFFSSGIVSLLFLLAAVGTAAMFIYSPKLIRAAGKKSLLVFVLVTTLLATLALAFASSGWLVALSFLAYSALVPAIYYLFDLFLEDLSVDATTGGIRGIYLTIFNIGIAAGPLILAAFSAEGSLAPVYVAVAIVLVVPILAAIFFIRESDTHGHHRRLGLPFKAWWNARSLRRTTFARFSLEFFFTFMIIYTPLYLYQTLGFDWSILGIMFSIMLLPFIMFQWPVGELADRYVGEKEFMITGFLFMIGSTLYMPYLGASAVAWTFVLFLSRVGASLVEVTTDSFFFKRVDAGDAGLISIFRLSRPVSVICGAAVGALALSTIPIGNIFFIVAAVSFFGLKEALLIRDTK